MSIDKDMTKHEVLLSTAIYLSIDLLEDSSLSHSWKGRKVVSVYLDLIASILDKLDDPQV